MRSDCKVILIFPLPPLNFIISAVQHERKPIIDKKEFNHSLNNYNLNQSNPKIFIKRDLTFENPSYLQSNFTNDLGFQLLQKRIGKKTTINLNSTNNMLFQQALMI